MPAWINDAPISVKFGAEQHTAESLSHATFYPIDNGVGKGASKKSVKFEVSGP